MEQDSKENQMLYYFIELSKTWRNVSRKVIQMKLCILKTKINNNNSGETDGEMEGVHYETIERRRNDEKLICW